MSQVKNPTVHEFLERMRSYFLEGDTVKKFANEEPFRSELFNTDQLEQHGRYLAKTHKVRTGRVHERLLKRLASNEQKLIEVRNLLTETMKELRVVTPAGEWLLDNFYLIDENIRTGKKHLPKGYSEDLPGLISGPSEGLPRVYDIATELISHSDGRIDAESLHSFIKAYQQITTLKLGELWAIPIMLRLALIENLRRVSASIAVDKVNRDLANYWAGQMTETADKDPKSLILVIADMARSAPPMESSFVSELIRKLMWKGPSLALPLNWMEQRLSEIGLTSNDMVNIENQKQAADQVSVSNSIGSLRFLSSMEWGAFVEEMSLVEHTLKTEQSGIYPLMDFATRDRYRHAVEKIAKYSGLNENDVAAIAVEFTYESKQPNDRSGHVGYYLVGDGLCSTEKKARQQLPLLDNCKRMVNKIPLTFYAGGIIFITLLLAGYLLMRAYGPVQNIWLLLFTAIIAIIACSHFATALMNWLATTIFKPDLLPRLDFSKAIPAEHKTLVVVPTMLANEDQVEHITEALEIRFLANRDENLYFGLLTDFLDATDLLRPEDIQLLELAEAKIIALNKKYATSEDRFFLFHRPRKWNPDDKIWMGFERKRGKLSELNELLRKNVTKNFSSIIGNLAVLHQVKYIITLDTDTQLPRDAAWKLVATIAHPLNRPYYDERKKRVTKGYGILQPRVSVSLSREEYTPYARMHGNETGIDPYTRLTSDVYQDLFQEGSFVGKGIYDIDAFEHTLNDRFPDNRILSHDLLEGCYTRAGLVSDVELFEEYPLSYSSDVNRRHRWIRGDWQIAYWALPVAPDRKRKLHKNPLSALARWKIFDNLRRSLVPAALTILLLMGWLVFHAAWFWTLVVVFIIMLPSIISSLWTLFKKPKELTLSQHLLICLKSLSDSFFQNAFMFICLPYEAWYSVDAIVRTTWRMLVSHRKLLEWNPSGLQGHTSDKTARSAYMAMWFSPFIALATLVCLVILSPVRLFVVTPVLSLWALAPFIAWWVSKPYKKTETQLSQEQLVFLRKISRKTWSFFERFVNAGDNWLPPDNYQENPGNMVAHRTSPTNIGLAMLANLSAYDFGYITTGIFLERTAHTIFSLEKMERHLGHFYNWYDTITLLPLYPRYVSTVDSGNMAAHLLVLRQGLLALPKEAIVSVKLFEGVRDSVYVLDEQLSGNRITKKLQDSISSIIANAGLAPLQAKDHAAQLVIHCGHIAADAAIIANPEASLWLKMIVEQCSQIVKEMDYLFPWLLLPSVPAKWNTLFNSVNAKSLEELAYINDISGEIGKLLSGSNTNPENEWLNSFRTSLDNAAERARKRLGQISFMASQCADFADIAYDFLYDRSKNLLTIGYNVEDHRCDMGYYDLLASEANLSIFVAVSQGKLPQDSWFALGRLLTRTGSGAPALLSWSGSMFEYLMPRLVMPIYNNTLLDQTHKSAVARQIEYAGERNVPWGISESGYNMIDANLNYQYQAFGVPGLGLKRGLADDLVIAPYASAMALMVMPEAACRNMESLSARGFEGRYGFFEAVDFTPSRLPRGQSMAIIQSYMAHHQGMSFLSLAYLLLDQPMQKRFEAELQFQATMLLLQERIPKTSAFYIHATDIANTIVQVADNKDIRIMKTPDTPIPEIQLLSNGKYNVMITNAGGGYSRWKDFSVTRWREDATCDNWGAFCYIRDTEDGKYWSNAYQPTCIEANSYEATFTQGRAEFRRTDNRIETYTEIVVSPEDDIEIRRLHITNRSRKRRTIEITTYAEVVLNHPAADALHPAFSNLFVQTEILENRHAILCTRRPRSVEERPPFMFHLLSLSGTSPEEVSYETDRARFIGRNNTVADPAALRTTGALSNTQGPVLDPIVAMRYLVTIEPEETVVADMILGIAETRDTCAALIDKYQDKHHKDRVFELAWTHSQVALRQINATEAGAQLYGRLASSIVYVNPLLRADPSVIIKNQRGQPGLWGYAISGDLPIILLQIESEEHIELAKQMVQAHAYWRLKGLYTDLVIWNEDSGGYRQVLQNQIQGLVAAGVGAEPATQPGGIFVRSADQISNEDRILFQTVARINICDKHGTLQDYIDRKMVKNKVPYFLPERSDARLNTSVPIPGNLSFFNGLGGFSADGREYVIVLKPGQATPAPWVNVLANPNFGTVVSECGQSYTWVENAHEIRLTPWENDAVCDKGGEAFYIRDEENGSFWSPTPMPAKGYSPYVIRQGFGYSIFEHSDDGIETEMSMFVDTDDPVKFFVLKIKNNSGRQRNLSVTGYIDLVLGDLKPKTGMYVITEIDTASGALLAKNAYTKDFSGRVAFFDTDGNSKTYTGDRTEFIGRNGSLNRPEAMLRAKLSGRTGAAMDPCAAIQSAFVLAEQQERTIVFRLGAGTDAAHASAIIQKFKGRDTALAALERVKQHWQNITSAIQVETPEPSINVLANGWLIYQTIACRLWARSGYYQSGGAYGYRDQLQDVLAVMHTRPALAREQVLLCASRQFIEGDVQHWWHPPAGRGVRTTCSDDYLWLPFVVYSYVSKTGDNGILNEPVNFLEGRALNPGESSYYDQPTESGEKATLYEHCIRAINHGIKYGEHGLPLIGSGDWNDGMDMVGEKGKGESVWLAFFLYDVLMRFSTIARIHADDSFAGKCINDAKQLKANIEKNTWDGHWYRRAYFDDGTPLGSETNDECQIDSISQSWAILSGAGDPLRTKEALENVDKRLVDKAGGLIKLLDPPFDKSALNPGYIKGYVPGIRENGGQYTHAAIWMIMAHARMGNAERAWELLDMINPVNHADTQEKVAIYKSEPYVSVADIYSVSQNSGRGGWTWYTGSAGWMYQLIIEWLLGIKLENNKLGFAPCIPASWLSFKVVYKVKETTYQIEITQSDEKNTTKIVTLDGVVQDDGLITLQNDSNIHVVTVRTCPATNLNVPSFT